MGLSVGRLIVATNENDILHRFFTKGEYHRESIAQTISPSMDICVSSNFERYLFHLAGNNPETLASWMKDFEQTHTLTITGELLQRAQSDFDSARADTQMTLDTIREYHEKYNYLLCPHSAVGVNAIHQLQLVQQNTVCLATAHDAKFPDAVRRATQPLPSPPPELQALESMPTRRTDLVNNVQVVQAFVRKVVLSKNDDDDDRTTDKWLWIPAAVAGVAIAAVIIQQVIARRKL
jgi:threonine synthase